MAEPLNRSQPIVSTKAHFILESRPSTLIVAHYADLPFPNIGPVQEVAFDLGITAVDGRAEVSGVVIKGYSGHQLLFEQRWPADNLLLYFAQVAAVLPLAALGAWAVSLTPSEKSRLAPPGFLRKLVSKGSD